MLVMTETTIFFSKLGRGYLGKLFERSHEIRQVCHSYFFGDFRNWAICGE